MNTPSPRPDGPETDGYLLAALRHAPDADQAAPAALGAAILREARAAVASPALTAARRASPRTAPRAWDRVEAFWRALARPPVAAGLASLMLATTLGLWWRDGSLDDPFPDRAPPPVAAPMEAATPAPRDAAPQAPAKAPAAAAEARSLPEPARPAMQAPATPATAPATAPTNAPTTAPTPAPQATAAPRAPAVAPPLAPPPSVQAAAPEPAAALGAERLPGSARVEAAPSVALPAVETPPPAEPPPPAVAMSTPQAPAPRSAPALGEAPARARSAPALAAAAAPADEASASTTTEALPSTTRLAQRLRDEPTRWRWLRGTSAPTALPSALPAWLDQVAAEATAAGVGWRRVASPSAPRTGPDSTGTLIGPDGSLHRFVISPEGLRWERPGSTALLLALPSPALQRLAAELP